jgi:hypothetical protein
VGEERIPFPPSYYLSLPPYRAYLVLNDPHSGDGMARGKSRTAANLRHIPRVNALLVFAMLVAIPREDEVQQCALGECDGSGEMERLGV